MHNSVNTLLVQPPVLEAGQNIFNPFISSNTRLNNMEFEYLRIKSQWRFKGIFGIVLPFVRVHRSLKGDLPLKVRFISGDQAKFFPYILLKRFCM